MTMYGANPDQLAELGNKLKAQRSPIDQVLSTVTSALGGTSWTGPARDRFEADWNGTFRSSLQKLTEAFDAAGQDCILRSQDLMKVMGSAR